MSVQVAPATASREPQQGRSRASYERMLASAENLLVQKANDDFTLNEVAKVGEVSIGSIYLRFDSKDDLIRAVQARVLARIDGEQTAMLAAVLRQAQGLDGFVAGFVEGLAELLVRHAPILRPIMLRATYDHAVSEAGKQSHDRFATEVFEAFLRYREAFGGSDHPRLVRSAYRMLYATLARYLGLGSSAESSGEGDWEELKVDLAIMCSAFLRASRSAFPAP